MKVRYTVPSAVTRAAYVGNGVTTVFSAPFNFFDDSDLDVILVNDTTAVETVQVLTTNYTVTGGDGSTGSVTMLVAPPTGTTLVIERDIPYTQEIDLEPNDPFPAEVTEEGFDRATMLAQQNRLEIQKSPKLPPTYDPDSDPEIRIPVPEAGKVLIGNEDEDGFENAEIADLDVAEIPVTIVSLANRDLLEYESAGATWKNQTLATVLKRMLTTAGDIAVNIAGTVSRLAVGTSFQVLGVSGGAPAWVSLDSRTTVNDAAYPVVVTDRVVAFTAISTARIVTLPAASSFPAGRTLVVLDASGSASAANTISLAPNTTNTIDGSNTTQVCINEPRGVCVLRSNGVDGWDVSQWSVSYTNSLSGDVALANTALYYDGPSVAQGAVGKWEGYGTVSIAAGTASAIYVKMWDGTNTVSSTFTSLPTSSVVSLALSGGRVSPAGNLRISVRNVTATDNIIAFNGSGNSKDSTITVRRVP